MGQLSCIRHPENSQFIRRHDWQIRALERPAKTTKRDSTADCGAEILSIMEYHYNNRMANRMLRELVEKAMIRLGKRDLHQLGDWMPYSRQYLFELLFGSRSLMVIDASLDLLVERKFASRDVPADIAIAYPTLTTWYRLEVDYINQWIDENIEKSWLTGWRRTRAKKHVLAPPEEIPEAEVMAIESDKEETKGRRDFNAATRVFKFYVHIHNKNANCVFDSDRRTKVTTRIREGRTPAQCFQAVIGNVLSDYHQGKHPDNTLGQVNTEGKEGRIYDDIELIFRNAKNFEKHIGYAEAGGVTEEVAMREFEAFASGQGSQYAKGQVKTSQTASNGQETALEPPHNASKYRDFAVQVASFFKSNTPIKDILEFCTTEDSLAEQGSGLVDERYLVETISEAIKMFREQGPTPEMAEDIQKFSKAFAELQSLNSEE